MIDFRRNILFCEQLDKVENFEEAVHDMNNTWVLHHRFETKCPLYKPTMEELIEWNLYYDRPPEEFIYMKKSEHAKLHNRIGNKVGFKHGHTPWDCGKHHSEETKEKISKANTGKKHSEETKIKMSESQKGHFVSDETRKLISESNKGKKHNITDEGKKRMCYGNSKNTHWYNNGIINKRCFECPEGFKEGRI